MAARLEDAPRLDVSKAIDKAAGAAPESPNAGKWKSPHNNGGGMGQYARDGEEVVPHDWAPATPEAAQWAGWGTALKPAWEPVIVARKPK